MSQPIPANRYVWFFTVALGGLALDLISKSSVFVDLGYPGESRWLQTFFGGWSTFHFQTSINHGALFGIGQGWTGLFAALSVVAVAGVLICLFKYGAAQSLWLTISLSLILAGTLGNLYDRLGLHGMLDENGSPLYGVRDFLLFTFGTYSWPNFNFADVFLVTGAIMLGLRSLQPEAAPEPKPDVAAGVS